MSATRAAKRAPRFTTYTEVEVDLEPEDLEREGWVYVGKSIKGEPLVPTTDTVLDVVRRWHDDTHDGPWVWCQHELCDQLRGRWNA